MTGKPGRSGRKPLPGSAQVVPLFRAGERSADIARQLGLSRQTVSRTLTRAGFDPRAVERAGQAARAEQVRRQWLAKLDRRSVAGQLGLTINQVAVCLSTLRRRGELK